MTEDRVKEIAGEEEQVWKKKLRQHVADEGSDFTQWRRKKFQGGCHSYTLQGVGSGGGKYQEAKGNIREGRAKGR